MVTETNQLDDSRQFAYDAAGNLTQKTDRNERIAEYDYDHLGRLLEERLKDGQSTLRTISFAYNAAGELSGYVAEVPKSFRGWIDPPEVTSRPYRRCRRPGRRS